MTYQSYSIYNLQEVTPCTMLVKSDNRKHYNFWLICDTCSDDAGGGGGAGGEEEGSRHHQETAERVTI